MQSSINEIRKAVEWCIFKRIPFVSYLEPLSESLCFWAAPSLLTMPKEDWQKPCEEGFFISKFNTPFSESYWIPFELTTEELLKKRMSLPTNPYEEEVLPMYNTNKEEYLSNIQQLVDSMDSDNRKTVISMIETKLIVELNAVELYFNMLGYAPVDGFGHISYHPATGFWIGATPELLFSFNKKNKKFKTMALAGTAPKSRDMDRKNIIENLVVSQYIERCLGDLGLQYKTLSPKLMGYGQIKHICIPFDGKCDIDPAKVIDALNPTPALCGYPKEVALEDIEKYEQHDRECYGGYIGINTTQKLEAYVNIRCLKFNKSTYRFYGGGGILKYSNPELEYLEAKTKIKQLFNMMIGLEVK